MASLPYEARLLDSWHSHAPVADIDRLTAELNVALAPQEEHPEKGALLRSLVTRMRAEEARLASPEGDLARLRQTAAIAQANLAAVPGCEASAGAGGILTADKALAQWLAGQVPDDLNYLGIDLRRVSHIRALAADELAQMRPVADLAGLNVIRFDGSPVGIKKVLERLKQAGGPVDDSGTAWLNASRFAGLAAYQRGPGGCPG
jgi:hypothetical protein